jgi:hypothetical protein
VRILFAITHLGFLRNFESTLALLAERGHQVHLVTDRRPRGGEVVDGTPIYERLSARAPGLFSWEALPPSKQDPWYPLSTAVREGLNYWRYLSPAFDDAPKLRERGRTQAPPSVVRLSDLPVLRSRAGIAALTALFRRLERAIPVRDDVRGVFDRWQPDVLLVTPLLYFGSKQVDYVRQARASGISSVLGVGSWDHLTTKGIIHEIPDRLLVWNELQRTEAAELHGVPPDRVVVTGAQAYDHWFAAAPSTTREEFCARVGLPADRPYILYLCSSPFIAPREVDIVRRWIAGIRREGQAPLAHAGILVRPHPQNAAQWQDVDLSASGAAIWPRAGANPIGPETRREYYDSMFHAHAMVGVNTSALIESGIVGRPVFSFRVPELAGTQEGTLHFHHLRRGGLLRLADDLPEHLAQLQDSFASAEADRERIRGFIQLFVRPYGRDVAATPRVVQAIEAQGAVRPTPVRPRARVRALQALLRAVVTTAGVPRAAAQAAKR